jgi:hypothetical protein
MKRIAMLMALSGALVALGSFSPFGIRWGHAALACDGGDGSGGGDGGNSGSGT